MIPDYLSPLANHLWQSTIATGVAALLALAVRKNAARVRYWLWFSAAVKFLIPFSILVSIGHQFEWRTRPSAAQRPISTVAGISMPFDSMPALSVTPSAASAARSVNLIPVVLVVVWLSGFVVSLWLWLRSWWRVRTSLTTATPMRLDLPMSAVRVGIMESRTLLEPAVFGVLKPVLLLPHGIVDRMTPDQLKAVLSHELCHVRRRDNLATAIFMMAETLFWFYPLVRWIGKKLIDERERACDEEVLRLGNEPLVYAEGILNICKTYLESPLPCASGVTGSDLKRRIRAILAGGIQCDLNFAKKAVLTGTGIAALAMPIAIGVLNAPSMRAQGQPRPTFEVASVKPNESGQLAMPSGTRGRTYTATNIALRNVIAAAYGLPTDRVVGGPSWLGSPSVDRRFVGGDRFDISAKLPEGTNANQVPAMLRTLLSDRFKLTVHTESREAPIYALVVARNDGRLGSQLRKASIDCEAAGTVIPAPDATATVIPELKPEEQNRCQLEVGGEIVGRGQRLSALARTLSLFADHPVVDRTGLIGGYDFELRFPELNTGPDGAGAGAGPVTGIFTALQEQLGLKLESIRGPLDFIVIDHVERPSEN
jgi:bla regulator protein BlaR1